MTDFKVGDHGALKLSDGDLVGAKIVEVLPPDNPSHYPDPDDAPRYRVLITAALARCNFLRPGDDWDAYREGWVRKLVGGARAQPLSEGENE